MPTYILLTTLTAQGVQTLRSNPDRLREVNRDVEELGAKVLHQWATLGPFDFVNVVEAPDDVTIARVSVALGVSGIAKRYGAVEALAGVDLEVAEGELVGLLGPNGAGKSTLTKIACGLVRPSAGQATICGAPAGSAPARAALGYLAELFRFPGWYSADEVLELHQRLAGSAGGADERTHRLDLVALRDARARRDEAMSKGMQQRLG